MFGNPVSELGQFGYGTFYAIPVAYMYLYVSETRLPLFDITTEISIILLLLSLYGAIWTHRVSLLIFGNDAGMESSRSKKVLRKHLIYFATGVKPQNLPDTKSIFQLMRSAMDSGINKVLFARFSPAGLFPLYAWIGWGWITFDLTQSSGNLIAAGLWIVLSVFLLRNLIAGYLPSYVPSESAKQINEAAYVTARHQAVETSSEQASKPRIRPDRSNAPSHQYRP